MEDSENQSLVTTHPLKRRIDEDLTYNLLFDVVGTSVIVIDKHGFYLFANKEASISFGLPEEEVIGKSIFDLVSPPQAQKYFERNKAFIEADQTETYEDTFNLPAGSRTFWITDRVLKDKNGIGYALQSCAVDITERKKAEQILLERDEKLQELNTAKDKFFSIIAHDLKGPMSTLQGLSELLVQEAQNNNHDQVAMLAKLIHTSIGRSYDLLENLLQWSMSQTGKLKFKPEYKGIMTLISDTILLLNDSAAKKSIQIVFDVKRDIVLKIDVNMITSVIRNLVSNAIKYTYTGGTVVVDTYVNDELFLLTVSDNGIGMGRELSDKIFDIRTEVSMPGTNKEQGTGLGLVLCKEFVEKHQGRIWVESEPGKGSKFFVQLPLENSHNDTVIQ